MTKFLNNADIKGYIAQTAVTSYLLKADSTGRLVAAIAGTDYVAPSGLSAYVPYTGATGNVDLGTHTLLATKGTFSSSGSSDTVGITHSSGSGIALNISKAGNGEGIYVNKSSGSGNAVTIVGTLNATTLVKNGGTSSQYLMADGSVSTLTNPVTGTGTSGIVAKFNGTSTLTDSIIYDNGTRVSIGADVTTSNKFVSVASTSSSYAVVAQASGSANGFWATLSGSGEIFRGQTSGGSYFIINNGGNAFLNGNLNVGDFASTSYRLNVVGTANLTGALTGTSANFSGSADATNNPGNSQLRASATSTKFLSVGYDPTINAGYLQGAESGISWRPIILNLNGTTTSPVLIGQSTSDGVSKLQVTGAATFSSSVTAQAIYATDATGSAILTTNGGGEGILSVNTANPLRMLINGSEKVRVTSAGNVGIGTTSPSVALDVVSAIRATNSATSGFASANVQLAAYNGSSVAVSGSIFQTSSTFAYQQIAANQTNIYGTAANGIRIATASAPIVFSTGNSDADFSTTRMTITSAGITRSLRFQVGAAGIAAGNFCEFGNDDNVGYVDTQRAVNSGDFHFRFDGTSRAYINRSTGVYVATSDINKKKDFEDSNIGLAEVLQLKPTLYRMESDESNGQKELGFIAQEVQGIIPSAYQESGDFIGLNFNPIVAALTKAIQELKAELDSLKNK